MRRATLMSWTVTKAGQTDIYNLYTGKLCSERKFNGIAFLQLFDKGRMISLTITYIEYH